MSGSFWPAERQPGRCRVTNVLKRRGTSSYNRPDAGSAPGGVDEEGDGGEGLLLEQVGYVR